MGRAATGAIEVYHPLCLWQRSEPLRVPVVAVGALVTDFDSHGSGCRLVDLLSIRDARGALVPPCASCQTVTLSAAGLGILFAECLCLGFLFGVDRSIGFDHAQGLNQHPASDQSQKELRHGSGCLIACEL